MYIRSRIAERSEWENLRRPEISFGSESIREKYKLIQFKFLIASESDLLASKPDLLASLIIVVVELQPLPRKSISLGARNILHRACFSSIRKL